LRLRTKKTSIDMADTLTIAASHIERGSASNLADADLMQHWRTKMNEHAKNLRRTRADMLGTDDNDHYLECQRAAAYIEQLEAVVVAAKAYEAERYHDTWACLVDALAALENKDE
jgi:predicted alpha/beta hydrolase family esterase